MSIRTNYEKWYEGDDYYWGLGPRDFLEELIELCPPSADNMRFHSENYIENRE